MDFQNQENLNQSTNNKSSSKRGCLVAVLIFISSCFLGIILIIALIVFLLIGAFKSISNTPIEKSTSFKQVYYSGHSKAQKSIALVNIKGIILNDQTPWYDTVSSEDINDQLDIISKDENIKAVILNIDSPGGEITATDKIHHKIEKIKKKGIPVVAMLNSLATSGGYYIAVATDYIIANRLTTTGSIGVIINSFNFYKLLKKIGVSDEVYKSKEMKDILNPARPRTEAEKKILNNLIQESYNEFVEIVSKGRIKKCPKLTTNYIKNSTIGDGRIFSGSQALKLGLVDKTGYFEDAENKAVELGKLKKDNYKIITFKEKLSLIQLIQKVYSNSGNINVNLNGIKTYNIVEPGKLYFLYKGY